MSFSSSRGSTPSSSPISIASRSSSLSLASLGPNFNSQPTACQPFNSSTFARRMSNNKPTSYVSDDDLLGADDVPYMMQAPPPPRPAEMWLRPLLPPVSPKTSRSKSSKQVKS